MSRSDIHVVLCTDGVYPHAMGGMQRHSRLLAEHLARVPGIRLTVIHPHAVPVFDEAFGIAEERIEGIDPDRFYLRELWSYSGRVGEVLERKRPDVILAQGFTVWKGIPRFTDRLIVHPHGLEMFQGITLKERLVGIPFRIALHYVVRRARVCISLGGRLTPILQHLVSGSTCEVVVLPNAVEAPAMPPAYPTARGPLRLLFVGRFAFNKGLDLLLQVARRLEQEGRTDQVHFRLAGDGPMMKELSASTWPANVELLGRVDDAQLEAAYAWCHALVLPTRFEGMPTVVLEAMARARPALVSDVGASAELVDASNGLLLRKGDADQLYRAIMALAGMSTNDRLALGSASRQRVMDRYTWPKVTQRTERILRAIVARDQRE